MFSFLSNVGETVSADKSKGWITLDRTYFKTGASELVASSQEQVKNIAEILKAFPKAKIKLGGYTDNTGDAEANKKISQSRADFVKAELVKLGIVANRIDAEGYGPEHPICEANDTKDCQAQNRRVDVRVTTK